MTTRAPAPDSARPVPEALGGAAAGIRTTPRPGRLTPWSITSRRLAGPVWEPCAGDGSLLARLLERCPNVGSVLTIDIDASKGAMVTADATLGQTWREAVETVGWRPEWIITGPPFADECEILQHAILRGDRGCRVPVALVSFVEPTRQRGRWLQEHPHDQRIGTRAMARTPATDSTDASTTTEWLIYVKDWRILTPPFGISAFGYRPRLKDDA